MRPAAADDALCWHRLFNRALLRATTRMHGSVWDRPMPNLGHECPCRRLCLCPESFAGLAGGLEQGLERESSLEVVTAAVVFARDVTWPQVSSCQKMWTGAAGEGWQVPVARQMPLVILRNETLLVLQSSDEMVPSRSANETSHKARFGRSHILRRSFPADAAVPSP